MHQTNLCKWIFKSALALAVIAGGVDSASAGWWHHGGGGSSGGWGSSGGYGGWGGSSGGWGSSGGYGGGSSGGYAGGYGYRGGLFHHHHHRAAYGGSSGGWGSSGGYGGGSSGGWGSSGGYGSSGGWGSSGGSSGGAVMGGGYYSPNGVIIDDGAVPMDATPTNPPPPPAGEGAAPADAPPADGAMLRRADGTLVVEVPAEAKIYVNNRLTNTPGAVREYVSRNLVRGYNYTYEVRAEMEINGETVSETKKIDLRAGQHAKLAFNLAAPSDEVETSITVKVPADAKVNLGGNDTKATGEKRTFRTSAIRKGSEWKDYKIVVTADVDGVEVTKEQTFDLKAGEEKELTFDFDAANVAAR